MLRRDPTTIQLTQADIDRYDANRKRRMWERQQQLQKQQQEAASSAQSSQTTEKAAEAPQKSKKDRVMGGNQFGAFLGASH
ncbi:hypothetical protein C7974DRAFT_411439 [Boeremia exigua]|uniref:uncharacterized protein n=1 Tax=Boeremia exigua TaxID=749465 RepID=UPI001E8E9CF2|nr:uncharacterized protein C7974DRAFT_411439 [Boeremia exigua]KAH6637988.1 hypothetical protein C7974DRAFT_411439 [Boeremia exigua]